MYPCRACNGCFLFCFFNFFVRYLGFCIFGGYLGLKRSHIFGGKKKKSQKARQRHIKHACKISGSNSQKRRGHLDFCAVKCKNHDLALRLLGFSIYSIWGVKFDLILILRSQFFEFLRETLCKHGLEHLKAAGPEKKRFFFPSYSKCLSIFDLFEGL